MEKIPLHALFYVIVLGNRSLKEGLSTFLALGKAAPYLVDDGFYDTGETGGYTAGLSLCINLLLASDYGVICGAHRRPTGRGGDCRSTFGQAS